MEKRRECSLDIRKEELHRMKIGNLQGSIAGFAEDEHRLQTTKQHQQSRKRLR